MKNTKIILLILILISGLAFAAPDTLDLISSVPGAACNCVEYAHGRLYVGAGNTFFVYQANDPANMELLGYQNFVSLITHIIVREDSMVFVGANHDAIYAVDCSEPGFPVRARYRMPNTNQYVSDLELTPPDTLWLSDNNSLKKMLFEGDTFTVIEQYLTLSRIAGAGFRDSLAAVTRRALLLGYVDLYNRSGGGFTHICTFSDSSLKQVFDVYFADTRDDILYVMGGSSNAGLTSTFFALQLIDDSFHVVYSDTFVGIPGFSAACIMKMDSRNDTLFLVTMAALSEGEGTWSTCPVMDATCLPDSLPTLCNLIPGLWFFDVAIHDSLPALAIASEWVGVLWTSFADLSVRDDTIRTYPTGGWGMHSYVFGGDTLYIAMEGYGVGIYDVTDKTAPEFIGRIPGEFALDLAFLDSILCLAKSEKFYFFNLAPWWDGGEIEPLDTFAIPAVMWETHAALCMDFLFLESGTLLALGQNDEGVNIVDLDDIPDIYSHALFYNNTSPVDIHCFGDTMFILMDDSLHIARYLGDSLQDIFNYRLTGEGKALCREGNLLAIACAMAGVFWYNWTGDSLIEIGSWGLFMGVQDVGYFDSLLYLACGNSGLYVLDIGDYPPADNVGWFPGTQGWQNIQYGCQSVSFGPDSTLYLSDFHAGCFLLEPFNRPVIMVEDRTPQITRNLNIEIYPNPFNTQCLISMLPGSEIKIYNLNGKIVDVINPISPAKQSGTGFVTWNPNSNISSGVYIVSILTEHQEIKRKVVFLK
ncbi:T9SS type A sorting domain-containing protein [bacterium]|nr:T9SS type A sorting domain-containing protein [bacterium]